MIKQSKHSAFFSVFLAFAPLLSIYRSPVPGMNLAELALCAFFATFLFFGRIHALRKSPESMLLIFVIYIFVHSILMFALEQTTTTELFRMIRFSFFYLTVALFLKYYLDYDLFFRWVKRITYVSVAFLILQYVVYFGTGRIILGVLQDHMYFEGYRLSDYTRRFSYAYRPSSFYSEPAHMAQYLCMTTSIALFANEKRKDLPLLATSVAGMLLSTSSQAILLFLVMVGYFFLRNLKEDLYRKVSARKLGVDFAFLFAFILAALWISTTDVFQTSLGRLLQTGEQGAVYARFNSYNYLVQDSNLIQIIFGHGFGSVPTDEMVPGLGYIFYGSGVVGIIIIAILVFRMWKNGTPLAKSMILVFVATLLGTSVFMNIIILPFFGLMLCGRREKVNQNANRVS